MEQYRVTAVWLRQAVVNVHIWKLHQLNSVASLSMTLNVPCLAHINSVPIR